MNIDDFRNYPAHKGLVYKKLKGKWNGCDVYMEYNPKSVPRDEGGGIRSLDNSGPHFIVEKDGEAWRADMDEAWDIAEFYRNGMTHDNEAT